MSQTILELQGIEKSFQETRVLNNISLSVNQGEFITLLGSSGCGKTTTLRIIAGLEKPDQGQVLLEGQDVTGWEPNQRDVNTVFQNYALFPHMSVESNIGYSLRLKRVSKPKIRQAVEDALDLVQLEGFEKRMPNELSGGQRQRVAIARAIVNQPKILLLDEPLGALDLQLRRQMQLELKRLQKQLGITFVYITHDQEEALNMSDRIVVMRDGRFEQIGFAEEIYNHPRTSYVARFVGNANVVTGWVEEKDENGSVKFSHPDGVFWAAIPKKPEDRNAVRPGDPAAVAVRSEHLVLMSAEAAGSEGLKACVKEKSFTAGMLRITLSLSDGAELIASRHGINSSLEPGDRVSVAWGPENAVMVDLQSGNELESSMEGE